MNTLQHDGVPTRRLDPFIFPADTDFRFALLVVAALGAVDFAYYRIYLGDPTNRDDMLRTLATCSQARSAAVDAARGDRTLREAADTTFARCRADLDRRVATWMAAGFVLLCGAASVIFAIDPYRKRLA